MKIRNLVCSVLCVLWSLSANAFTEAAGSVRGRVIDAQTKEPMEFVNVSVRKSGSTLPLTGAVTDPTGEFQLGKLTDGNYILSVSFIGYKTFEKEFTYSMKEGNIDFKTIGLSPDSQVLGEVKVMGQKPQMKFEIDKKVFNVDQNIASTGGTASDVLSNIPSVEVDNEGEVSLRGSTSVTIWINGKASGLSADNRAQILEQMPAESIEKIEVITNPSAKYSPEGTSGIINIVLKEDRKAGYYGSLQAGVDTRKGWSAGGNINYSSGKLDVYANVGYRRRVTQGGGLSERTNLNQQGEPLSFLNQRSENDGHGGPVFVRAGATYHMTRQDHLNVGAFGMFGGRKQTNTIDYTSNIPGSFTDRTRITDSKNNMQGGNVELGYKHDFSKTSNLDITASWNPWNMDQTSVYNQYSVYENREEYSYQRQESDVHAKGWEVQADYVNAFTDNGKLEAGYKGSFTREKSPVETFSGLSAETAIPDEALYNKFYYDRDVQALYATYSGRIEKFGFQAGLRGEYSVIKTRSLGYAQTKEEVTPYKHDYFSFFPSVFLSYELPAGNEVQVNYTRRISRPWGRQLNPFVNVTDSTNISYGNPYLDAEFSNAFELNYIKNWESHLLSVSAYYRSTSDVIQRISYLEEEIMKSTFENVAKSQAAGVEFVLKNNFARILDLTTTVNLYYNKLDGFTYFPAGVTEPVTGKADEDFSWNAKMIANIALPASVSLQLTGSYNSRQLIAQGYRKSNYTVDAGLRKSFLDRKLSLSINARDIFDSRKWKTQTSGEGFSQYAENWRTGRTVGFTLTYSFGNLKPSRNRQQQTQPENNNMMNQMEDVF